MSNTLHTLARLREHARKESQAKLSSAQVMRDEQDERVQAVRRAVDGARETKDPADLLSIAAWHTWRLRQEVVERREVARLHQRERDLDSARTTHGGRVRDELAIGNAIEAEHLRGVEAALRAETRTLDEVGARRRSA
jgi:hypothetical protein